MEKEIQFGNRRLVGQQNAREQISRIIASKRTGHAYLFTGPKGSGKMAFALAFAEVINGIDHFTDLKGGAFSKKSSWFNHPDIHVFFPIPKNTSQSEIQARIGLLHKDPYEIIDFSLRPVITEPGSSKNLQAFYPIDYYNQEIRPATFYKPNEGRKTVVILSDIETMRKEAVNAFLKLLEEPSENVMFILTSSRPEQLLPTIVSRCQEIRLQALSSGDIEEGLTRYDGISREDAAYLARISDGSYSLARFYDIDELRQTREELVDFLRFSYTQDARSLTDLITTWQKRLNRESQIGLCNTLEQLLRDILVYRETAEQKLITNISQIAVIRRFSDSMKQARLEEMIEHLQHLKQLLYQNIQFKLVMTALSFRFFALMRGEEPYIPKQDAWRHLPAFSDI
ncbi:MAG TPA: AAA family ATPase [Balneolaceae bacterium]|nr:AAA family ATPase [Balneolaceae bacterium]